MPFGMISTSDRIHPNQIKIFSFKYWLQFTKKNLVTGKWIEKPIPQMIERNIMIPRDHHIRRIELI